MSLFCVLQGADFTALGVVFVASQMKRQKEQQIQQAFRGFHILVSGLFTLPRAVKPFPSRSLLPLCHIAVERA